MTERQQDALEDAYDTIRGLEETVAAQVKRLAEIAKLRDIAHDAKVYLIGEHAAERAKRQNAEQEIREAHEQLGTIPVMASGNLPHRIGVLADETKAGREARKGELAKRQGLEVAVGQAQTVIADLLLLCRRVADGESNAAEAFVVFERAHAWQTAHGRPT